MSLARSVGRNTIVQLVGKLAGTVLGLIAIAILARYLGPTKYGAYTAVMAYTGFFSVIADLGLYLILSREMNKPNADGNKIVGNLLGIRMTSAAIVLLGSALVAWVLPFYSVDVKTGIQIGALSFLAVAGSQLLVAVFQSNYNTLWVMIGEVTGRVVLVAVTALVAVMHGGLYSIMGAVAAGSITNLLIILATARRYVSLRPRFDFPYWRYIIRDTLPVSISIVLSLIYFKADTILLSVFHKGDYAIGLYGAAYKVLEVLITFPTIFVGLLLPALSRTYNGNDRDGFIRVFQRGFESLIILVTPIFIGGWMLAREILVVVGSADFAPAAGVLRLLLIAVTMSYLNTLSAHTVTIINRQRQMVWGYLAVAVAGVATYLALIPSLSYNGAAIGTILTETLTPLIGYIIIFRVVKFRTELGIIPKVLFAAALMVGTILLLKPLNPWVALGTSAIVYAGAALLVRAVPWSMVKEVLGRQSTVDVLPPT